ncbi:MAG: hypothetical protein HYV60_24410 [Planctomycetia bacterium]|nr:hypothetical protein [Planctomycetia bacterium]
MAKQLFPLKFGEPNYLRRLRFLDRFSFWFEDQADTIAMIKKQHIVARPNTSIVADDAKHDLRIAVAVFEKLNQVFDFHPCVVPVTRTSLHRNVT